MDRRTRHFGLTRIARARIELIPDRRPFLRGIEQQEDEAMFNTIIQYLGDEVLM